MTIKCNICGFTGNASNRKNCIKCNEVLDVENTSGVLLEQEEVKSLQTIIKERNQIDEDETETELMKRTRIVDESSAPNHQVDESKETLFVQEFDINREKRLSLELYPIGDKESQKALRFFEEDIVLSREDIDMDDLSVSSKDHVQFTKTETGWKMKNLSSNGAVFIRVVGEVDIYENDIVIIGKNKTFLFKPRK